MAHESSLWNLFKRHMEGPRVDLLRVENSAFPGTPDVNYSIDSVDGWIELKELDKWPVRATSIVKIPHYTPHQRLWHRQRTRAGGRTFLLLRVNSTMTFMLFHGPAIWEKVGKVNQEELRDAAVLQWGVGFSDEVIPLLRAWLTYAAPTIT